MKKNIFTYDVFQEVVKNFVKESYGGGSYDIGGDSSQLSGADKDEILKGILNGLIHTDSVGDIRSKYKGFRTKQFFSKRSISKVKSKIDLFLNKCGESAIAQVKKYIESNNDVSFYDFGFTILLNSKGNDVRFLDSSEDFDELETKIMNSSKFMENLEVYDEEGKLEVI